MSESSSKKHSQSVDVVVKGQIMAVKNYKEDKYRVVFMTKEGEFITVFAKEQSDTIQNIESLIDRGMDNFTLTVPLDTGFAIK